MKKVLVYSPTADGTGFSHFANDFMLGLDAAGVDTVSRTIKLAGQMIPPPARVEELEAKNANDVDIIIQSYLPSMFYYINPNPGKVKLGGLAHFETTGIIPSCWQYYCNLLDFMLVANDESKECLEKSGVKKPIFVIPKPCNPEIYKKEYAPLVPNIEGKYKFLHIGDYSARKNIFNLIKTYLRTFDRHDNVVLILKTYFERKTPQESSILLKEEIAKAKAELRRFNNDKWYPPIIIITDYIGSEQILRLHSQCDCFVTAERGASWNIPAFDAAAFGKWVIACGWGGQTQFLRNEENASLVSYKMRNVEGMTSCSYPNLYTCHEQWADPDMDEIGNAMRSSYNDKFITDPSSLLAEYSYKIAGTKIKEILEVL